MSMMVSFVLSFFPPDVLDEILNLIESVSEDFPSYSCNLKQLLNILFCCFYFSVIQGILKEKPRILVTHQLQFLPVADHIIILKEVSYTQMILMFLSRGKMQAEGFAEAQRCPHELPTYMIRKYSTLSNDRGLYLKCVRFAIPHLTTHFCHPTNGQKRP